MEVDTQNINKPKLKYMRKLIDLDGDTFKALSIMSIEAGTNLKSYIESVLVTHAGGGSKKENLKSNKQIKKAKN